MGKRGPLGGKSEGDKAGRRAMRIKRAVPKCPDWLPFEAKKHWRRLVSELKPTGVLSSLDALPLASLAVAWHELQEATLLLAREGRVLVRASGGSYPHPAVGMQRSAWQAVERFSALFGLDPASRSRIELPPPEALLSGLNGKLTSTRVRE